jgi:hypothetical protein
MIATGFQSLFSTFGANFTRRVAGLPERQPSLRPGKELPSAFFAPLAKRAVEKKLFNL